VLGFCLIFKRRWWSRRSNPIEEEMTWSRRRSQEGAD